MVQIIFKRLPHGGGLPLPSRQSSEAAGLDLSAATPEGAPVSLAPGARALIPTGFAVALPPGYEGQVRPRSGLALKYGVTVLNTPGTVDSDYRGEIGVLLINFGAEPFVVSRGDRVAQFIVSRLEDVETVERDGISGTYRGGEGFGSTGR